MDSISLEVAAPKNRYLSLIKNAEHVLTASFHGTAFSILFGKQFPVARGKHNGKVNMDDRMSSLLSATWFWSGSSLSRARLGPMTLSIMSVCIRWLDVERNRSLDYLQSALQVNE
ncbi:MAG: polysaccharide pyruvyl transferase family protein [Bifidobacterium sp.]